MKRLVIALDAAKSIASRRVRIPRGVSLLAPTLLRSELLADLYGRVRAGELGADEAKEQLDFVRGLRIRLLGDRVLQAVAWRVADALDWPDTRAAEYIALTKLQADALVTDDRKLAAGARRFVAVARLSSVGD
jgi:predicted nucleic acid-binding protein